MPDVDLTDPCARATYLRDAYYRLLGGNSETRIRYKSPHSEEETWFYQTDLKLLLSELRNAEAECSTKTGNGPRRYAIRAGARRC